MIVSRLFTERMYIDDRLYWSRTLELQEDEAVIIRGAERFCYYEGYREKFTFTRHYEDTTIMYVICVSILICSNCHRNEDRIRDVQVVAFDALKFSINRVDIQFNRNNIVREVNKAFVAFCAKNEPLIPIATGTRSWMTWNWLLWEGNWGCGAFHGDLQLKAVIQIMAASQVCMYMYQRCLCYDRQDVRLYTLHSAIRDLHKI